MKNTLNAPFMLGIFYCNNPRRGSTWAFIDAESKSMIGQGDPKRLLAESNDPKVIAFLIRGEENRVR